MASYSAPMRSLTPGRQTPGMDAAASARAQQQHRANAAQQLRAPFVQQQPSGPVAILWDIENCSVPGEVNAEDVAGNIRIALRDHPYIGAVTMFSAYGDFNQFPRKVREGCQRTGVNLIDVPNGKKDAADKAILVDMFLFALDNPPPSTIFLITGDVDFAPALHKLGQRGYMVVLVIPDGVGVSSALRGAGRFVWDWSCLCRGDGFVPATKTGSGRAPSSIYRVEERIPVSQGRVSNNLYPLEDRFPVNQYQNAYPDYNAGPWAAEEPDPRNDDNVYGEEILAWRPRSNVYNVDPAHSYSPVHPEKVDYEHLQYGIPGQVQPQGPRMNTGNVTITRSVVSAPPSMRNQVSSGFPSRSLFPTPEAGHVVTPAVQPGSQPGELGPLTDLSEPTSPGGSSATSWVQPGDLPGLKRQLVKLLKLNGGKMALPRVPAEYCKQFGRPLYLAEYNALKLVHLIEKMKDTLAIKGDGTSKTLHLAKKETRGVTNNKYKPVGNRGSAPKSDKDKDASEDSEPEGPGPTVKEVEKETNKMDFGAADVLTKRHLLDMDMDETIVVQPTTLADWDSGSGDEKANNRVTNIESSAELGEVDIKQEDYVEDVKMATFKRELQELLVVYAYKIKLKLFVKIYQKRYARDLDLQSLGVNTLESLFYKVKDVAVIKHDADLKELAVVAV